MGARTTVDGKDMTARLVNARDVPIRFYLEPWGEEFEMPPAAVFVLDARGPQADPLEVLVGDDQITVWAGPGAVVTLWHDGAELGAGHGPRTPVPPMPEWGESVAQIANAPTSTGGRP
jgi:hypothetical protein